MPLCSPRFRLVLAIVIVIVIGLVYLTLSSSDVTSGGTSGKTVPPSTVGGRRSRSHHHSRRAPPSPSDAQASGEDALSIDTAEPAVGGVGAAADWKKFIEKRSSSSNKWQGNQRCQSLFPAENQASGMDTVGADQWWRFPFGGAQALSQLLTLIPRSTLCDTNANPFCGRASRRRRRKSAAADVAASDVVGDAQGRKTNITTDDEDATVTLALGRQSRAHAAFINTAALQTSAERRECRPPGPQVLQEVADIITSSKINPAVVCSAASAGDDSSSRLWSRIPEKVRALLTVPLSVAPSPRDQQKEVRSCDLAQSKKDNNNQESTVLEANCIVASGSSAAAQFEEEDKAAFERGVSLLDQVVSALSSSASSNLHWGALAWSSSAATTTTAEILTSTTPETADTDAAGAAVRHAATGSNADSSATVQCLSVNMSGPAFSHVRLTLLKDKLLHELALFSDAAFIVPFAESVSPLKSVDYFFNGNEKDAVSVSSSSSSSPSRPVTFPQALASLAAKTGGFPTFDYLGSQPGFYVAVFTRAIIGANYIFTCSGTMFGNGGAKEHRFEFAGAERNEKVSASRKLPCQPLAAAFSRPPVKIAVPLCTSRYCRWYGIYHFFLEHLPQLVAALHVLRENPAAVLVVTELPSMTIRSLLVDVLGIPASRMTVGPVRADVALLPTPGLVYRPMSHALRALRRIALTRMGLNPAANMKSSMKTNSSHNAATNKSSSSSSSSGNSTSSNSETPVPSPSALRHYPRRSCAGIETPRPEIRILFSERTSAKATVEQKQTRLPKNWNEIKSRLRSEFHDQQIEPDDAGSSSNNSKLPFCVRFQTEKEIREDVRDTIHAFYEADIVIGVHGANLLFVTFMRRSTHLIEIISDNAELNPRCFFHLAQENQVKYSALLHDGAFKLKEYNYVLNPEAVVRRVNASIVDLLEHMKATPQF